MALQMKACPRHQRAFNRRHPKWTRPDPRVVGIAWQPFCIDCNGIGAPAPINLRRFGVRFLQSRDGSRFVVGDGQLALF